jgi:hypothetical protein
MNDATRALTHIARGPFEGRVVPIDVLTRAPEPA